MKWKFLENLAFIFSKEHCFKELEIQIFLCCPIVGVIRSPLYLMENGAVISWNSWNLLEFHFLKMVATLILWLNIVLLSRKKKHRQNHRNTFQFKRHFDSQILFMVNIIKYYEWSFQISNLASSLTVGSIWFWCINQIEG